MDRCARWWGGDWRRPLLARLVLEGPHRGEGVRKPVFHPSDVGEAAAYRNPRHLMGGRTL